jgi:homocysteine S-methyltransferase
LRTNTFAANKYLLETGDDERTDVIKAGYEIALGCAEGKDVYVAADIGPVSSVSENEKDLSNEDKLAEFKKIIDVFLDCGAEIFIFETMTSAAPLDEAVAYLRGKSPDAYIICQFALHPDSHTGSGIALASYLAQRIVCPQTRWDLTARAVPCMYCGI